MHIHSLRRAALAACAVAVLAASSASAASTTTQLRVEANGHDIGPGWTYAHDSVTYDTSQSAACGGTGQSGSISGPSALGLLVQGADYTRRLRPVQLSDKFEGLGPFVCGVGSYTGSDSAFWLYKVDHVAPEVGGDQFTINNGHEEVLWYFVDTATGANTGNELFLSLGDRIVKAGEPTAVMVLEYDATGQSSPAAGVRIIGGNGAVTDATGTASLTFDDPGRQFIRGDRGNDIPTDGQRLCVWEASKSECDEFIATRVVGTNEGDRISGTDEPERFIGRDGDDRITSRGDDVADTVRCGPGNDVARADRLDQVARNCETVRRA